MATTSSRHIPFSAQEYANLAIQTIVKNLSKKIKGNENELKKNDALKKQLKAEFDDLGIFAYPYINEEIKAGNNGFENIGINKISDEENEKIKKVIQKLKDIREKK